MAARIWAGLDVGAQTTSICVMNETGCVMQETVCPTDLKIIHEKIRWMKRRRHATVGLEASGGSALARGLRTLGYSVDLYETRRLSKFLRVRRNKTDSGDAVGIAEAGRIGASLITRVYLKSLESQTLQSRLIIRRYLIRQRVSATNLLGRQLQLFGGMISRTNQSATLRMQVEAQLKVLFGKAKTPLRSQFSALVERCEELLAAQLTIDRDLKVHARSIEVCRRFMEIPGVGPICALTFYAAIADPHRFRRSTDVGSYLGLAPRVHQSGVTLRRGRISKMGNKEVRSLLVGASLKFMSCSSGDGPLRQWADAIQLRAGRGKAKVALARKLATVMIAMWKNGSHYTQRPATLATRPAVQEFEGTETTFK